MKYLFEENQKFTQWWLWFLLVSFLIMSFVPFVANEIKINYVLIGFMLPFIFYLFELRVKVSNKGLHYKFFPFHFKFHTINIEDIEKIEALQYKPLAEYGGWGIKYGFKGKAYNVIGNKGVKIFLKNGLNIMFGSQKHNELAKALKSVRRQ